MEYIFKCHKPKAHAVYLLEFPGVSEVHLVSVKLRRNLGNSIVKVRQTNWNSGVTLLH